ncbi:MAG: MaoC/PaaZ C-terminal domain-containing protein [Thermodesulfobacteriota bacterium]
MPLSAALVGTAGDPVVHDIDARWLMAYAAGLGDTLPCYLDTRRPEGIIPHPLFPVCFEWPAVLAMRGDTGASLTAEERLRAVHATHDLILYRGVRPGGRVTTRATVVGVERRKPGAYQVTRLDTTDATGALVCTTWQGTLYRGVGVEGPDRPAQEVPALPRGTGVGPTLRAEVVVPIPALAAHVYTECARIWNPIHTDLAVAERAGLPGLILHGTATLALAVSRIIEVEAENDPPRVWRVAGRFGAMVRMPSEVTVRVLSRRAAQEGEVVGFEVWNQEGQPAVRDGLVILRSRSAAPVAGGV